MSSKLDPVIWLRVLVTLAYMKGRTDVRTYVRTLYVRTDVDDVMAIKPNFPTSMGYHVFLTMVLRYNQASLVCKTIFDNLDLNNVNSNYAELYGNITRNDLQRTFNEQFSLSSTSYAEYSAVWSLR